METTPTTEFVTHRCRTCDGVAHPATGCVYSPTFIVCGPCTRKAWAWIVDFTSNKRPYVRKGQKPPPLFANHVNRVVPGVLVIEE